MNLDDILYANWNDMVPQSIANRINDITRGTSTYFRSRSRTLNDLLYHSLNQYYTRSYITLLGLCTMYTHKAIQFYPIYDLITSEDSESLTLDNIINRVGNYNNTTKTNIIIYHIAKGKSYLKNILEDCPSIRLKNLETLCIENIHHFVRIYQGFGNTKPDDIVIFTDTPTRRLLNTIVTMLPNILNIQQITEDETEPDPKITTLRNIFAYLFELQKNNNEEDKDTILNNIKEKINAYTELFNFATADINNFISNLAKVKNNAATEYYNRKLSDVLSQIENYETRLEEYYANKATYERELIANQAVSVEDVQPFLDTINNSKAFEILDSTPTNLKIKITAPLQYFTSSDFETYEKNPMSYYNTAYAYKNEALKSILHKIFVTKEYKIPVQSIIKITLNEGSYYGTPISFQAQTNSLDEFTEFPNPHLYHHDCWGAAKTEMIKNINENHFELAALQMIAATQSVNVAESASFVNGFLQDFNSNYYQHLIHIIDETGTRRSFTEALEHERNILKNKIIEEAKTVLETNEKQGYTQVEIPDDEEDENETN